MGVDSGFSVVLFGGGSGGGGGTGVRDDGGRLSGGVVVITIGEVNAKAGDSVEVCEFNVWVGCGE